MNRNRLLHIADTLRPAAKAKCGSFVLGLGAALAIVLAATGALGLETFVIGGAEHPWEDWGTAPGGVIDFAIYSLSTPWGDTLLVPESRYAHPDSSAGEVPLPVREGWIITQQVDPEENIALGTYKRGGEVISPNVFDPFETQLKNTVSDEHKADGAFERKRTEVKLVNPLGVILVLDLGARFGVDRIRFYPRNSNEYPFQDDYMRAYEISLNDGSEETSVEGIPIFRIVRREDENADWDVDLNIPLQYVRYVRIKSLTTINWEVDEIEVYGTGYVPEAAYESDVLDMERLSPAGGPLATWGNIWWHEQKIGDPAKSRIIVRTRSGEDDTPLIYYRILQAKEEVELVVSKRDYDRLKLVQRGSVRYFGKDGTEVTKEGYEALPSDQQGEVIYHRKLGAGEQVDTDKNGNPLTEPAWEKLTAAEKGDVLPDLRNWSVWSPPYDYEEVVKNGGVPILSPAPQPYFQFRVDFKSDDLAAAGSVDSLGFQFSKPPVAHEIVAEIAAQIGEKLSKKVTPGEVTTFRYAVRPTISGDDTGFDSFEIATPTEIEGVEAVRIDGAEVAFTEALRETHRFVVSFPRVTKDQTLLDIWFKGVVLRYGTTFSGKAFDSEPNPTTGELELPQVALAGDATDEIGTNDLSVWIDLGGSLIGSFEISPNPFTPNEDNANDVAAIQYNLLQLTREMPVSVKLYDLSGKLVRTLFLGRVRSGQYAYPWDGKDDDGETVPLGLYLVRVSVDTDSGAEEEIRVVSVVY